MSVYYLEITSFELFSPISTPQSRCLVHLVTMPPYDIFSPSELIMSCKRCQIKEDDI